MLKVTPIESTGNVNRALAPTTGFGGQYSARRLLVVTLTTVSMLGTTSILVAILSHGNLGFIAYLAVAAFLVNMTWVALSFWNSLIGFLVRRDLAESWSKRWIELKGSQARSSLNTRTAVVITTRNDNVEGVFARIKAIRKSLESTGFGAAFDYFILSDSSMPEPIAQEECAIASWQAEDPSVRERVVYRRRLTNLGFKAGNVTDFCTEFGKNYEFMVLLDADSLMSGDTIVQLVQIMQNQPQLGILQSLMVGVLCSTLFAHIFEFGHRHAWRCSIAGAAWWQGDRCQSWGHNAVIRLAPFMKYCEMPFLPGEGPFGGHILCHDQIEASFMHRAGYEVRIFLNETGSYEGVPPTLVELNKRDNQWCHGNLKAARVAGSAGLPLIDRFHLLVVAQRFLSQPALLVFVMAAAVLTASWPVGKSFPTGMALGLYALWMLMFFSPRIFGVADAILSSAAEYGGKWRLLLGASIELMYSFLLAPISAIATTACIIGLPFQCSFKYDYSRRNAYVLTFLSALRVVWLQTVVGIILCGYLFDRNASAILWFAPFLAGLVLAVPFASLTSLPSANRIARQWKLCLLPEEVAVPLEIADVVQAEKISARKPDPLLRPWPT
jgi:membrane glycosyltransferase